MSDDFKQNKPSNADLEDKDVKQDDVSQKDAFFGEINDKDYEDLKAIFKDTIDAMEHKVNPKPIEEIKENNNKEINEQRKTKLKEIIAKKNKQPDLSKPKEKKDLIADLKKKTQKLKKEKVVKEKTKKENKKETKKETKQEVVKQAPKKKVHHKLTKKEKRTITFAAIVWVFVGFMFLGCIGGGFILGYFLKDMPDMKASDLKAPDSTIIYDCNGDKVIELGTYLRENVDYEEMPNNLIDAFLAVEDSRFFSHIGFDIPRFMKAILVNLRSGDFEQGGSTITMQLIKNTYYTVDDGDNSTLASRSGMGGIQRKLQEIFLSIKLTLFNMASKQDTIAMYINKVNYGNNIRGVEKAAQYYFGKSTSQLNLSESAFLAGCINSPNWNNPYNNLYDFEYANYLENGTQRRDEVLDLMLYHGYISEEECDLAKSIKLEDQLVGERDIISETKDYAQGYINRVIDEVIEQTGEDPYSCGMSIYTNMDPYMQQLVYDMQNERAYTGIEFSNDMMNNAIVVLNNQDGSLIALGGGRGETVAARQLNRATDCYLNPGSSIKPVVDYSLAFEVLGWSTDHVLTDMPYYLYSGNVLVTNFDKTFHGDVTVLEAVARSLNTTAVQALDQVIKATSEEYVVDYLNSIGFDFAYEDFDLQFAIGGNRCLVTPLQLAGAHAIFMNDGMYVEPHTVNYIVFNDGRENYVADTIGHRALSSEAAYMTAYLEYYVINGIYGSTAQIIQRDYPVYGKTGTTDWGDGNAEYHIPAGSTKDCWLVGQTNTYTIATWLGYDIMQERSYFTNAEYYDNTKSYIVDLILDKLYEHYKDQGYDPYAEMEVPEGITEFTHTLGAYPYAYPDSGYSNTTGYIAQSSLDKQPLVSVSEVLADLPVKNVNSFVSNVTGGISEEGNAVISFAVAQQTGEQVGDAVDVSATNVYGETTHALARSYFPHAYYNILDNSTGINFEIIYETDEGDEVVLANGSSSGEPVSVALPGIYSDMQACAWIGEDHRGRTCSYIN